VAVLVEKIEAPYVGDIGPVPGDLDPQCHTDRLGSWSDDRETAAQHVELSVGDLRRVGQHHRDSQRLRRGGGACHRFHGFHPRRLTGDPAGQTGPMQPTEHQRRSTIAAVVLAAGAGSRFGGDDHKLLTEVKGKPIVRHVIDAARAAEFDEVIVVSGAVDLADVVPDDVTLIHNEKWDDGQATSLRAAVAYADMREHVAVVVGLGDSPGVDSGTWQAVADADADLAAASFDGKRRPPVKIADSLWASLPISGDEGARSLLNSRSDLVLSVPCDGDPADIDTQEDLRRWR